ncbi:ABC transporter [Halosimplex carlsbadense 2-9-1]|uniref:ABC transporter n=1 Tax=Halosimplex carlsbadense 2-9-1 TaxID=797114 RepID=M0D069_9EURY|nr:ABC transporter permease subunit [Halosimplex carlsbadense]ELZ27514.1 ABC transporter [Halosimplex carlsbadense 2-9-1]
MSTVAVAKKDFRDAVQSRALWGLLAVFVVLSVLLTYSYVEFPQLVSPGTDPSIGGLVFFTAGIVSLFVSLTAIVVCYKAIAGEREIGSVKLLLALPHRRRDVLFGKLLGRMAVLSLALAIGLAVGFGFAFAMLGSLDVVTVLLFLLATLLFTAVYVSVVVGISATTGSTSRATTLAIGFFVVFEFLWDVVPIGAVYVANGFSLPQQMPEWTFLVMQVPPSTAYTAVLTSLLPDVADSLPTQTFAGAGVDAFYAVPEIGFVVLAFWLVVPLAVGYYRFRGADL